MPPQSFPLLSFPSVSHSFPAANHTSQETLARIPQAQPSMSTAPARWPSHTLSSAVLQPPPPHAVAQEPPPVSSQLRSQILAEIQNIGSRIRLQPDTSSSLFRTHIPIDHPLSHLHTLSMELILQAVSPRTLRSYWTAWNSFKNFHTVYNLAFPDFSLLSITSFISHMNSSKSIQPGSIKVYLSGIHFFFKIIHGHECPAISNPQTSLLIKGLQKTHPTKSDTRQPLTIDLLGKCLTTIRSGVFPPNITRTLDAMFILAFFGFLRVSEFTTNSTFNPANHATISDLKILNHDTIRFNIKQSKTDQLKRGHPVFIFNLPTPIQPYQSLAAFLSQRHSQTNSPLAPLFLDENNYPASRHWFQRKLKTVLARSGISIKNFSSHSFRIGAATTAAQKGLSETQIKMLGRWTSHTFESYVRSNLFHIRQAHQTLTTS
ncbi:uncharacterized protein [Pseudorasbora parva]|uniref:uncharacterized protein n=1 Tax=Pseudorasbora parva TaxID=51549 RepID=UPI00351F661C